MEERKRDTDLLFHSCMRSLIDSWMFPDQGLNHNLGASE